MERNFWTFLAVCAAGGLALVLLATWQADREGAAEPADAMLLRVHVVPPARADDIRVALANSLSMGEGQVPLGRVSTTGTPGQLLVLAPESVQDDIDQAIAALGADAPPPAAPASVVLDLWSVDAVPGEGADDPTLAPIASALDAARGSLGAVRFEHQHALSIVARGDGSSFGATTPGKPIAPDFGASPFQVRGNLRATQDGVTARLVLEKPSVETTIDLRFGETLVLAQVAVDDGRTQVIIARARPANARG